MVFNSRKRSVGSLPSSTLASLPSLPPPSAPHFPNFKELVDHRTFELSAAEEMAPSSSHPVGLFEGLLQGHAELLAADVDEHPERYTPEVPALVRDIMERRKDAKALTGQERAVMDRATLDFATYIPPKSKPPSPPRRSAPRAAAKEEDEGGTPIPGLDTPPEATAPAYWWLR